MEYSDFELLLKQNFQQNELPEPNDDQTRQFYELTNLLLQANESMNLTAVTDIPGVVSKHYADSLLAIRDFPEKARVLDVGCGAGFPSLPLSIMRPDLTVIALDSTAKKIGFVQTAIEKLQLDSRMTAVSGRAEDAAIRKKLGQFGVVTSRAVARLNVLCELCLPYAKIGGKTIALKGAKGSEELAEAQNAVKILGGETSEADKSLVLPDGATEQRDIIIIRKKSASPAQYPRAYAAILKRPL